MWRALQKYVLTPQKMSTDLCLLGIQVKGNVQKADILVSSNVILPLGF